MQGMSQLCQISGGIWALPNPPILFAHKCSIGDRAGLNAGRLSEFMLLLAKKLQANSSNMGPGIVMMEDQVARFYTWDGSWAEDFVFMHDAG